MKDMIGEAKLGRKSSVAAEQGHGKTLRVSNRSYLGLKPSRAHEEVSSARKEQGNNAIRRGGLIMPCCEEQQCLCGTPRIASEVWRIGAGEKGKRSPRCWLKLGNCGRPREKGGRERKEETGKRRGGSKECHKYQQTGSGADNER